MYARLGIPRDDKAARRRWFANNFAFFGAPMALFCSIDRSMGPPQWSTCGMYLQTVMLLLREEGPRQLRPGMLGHLPETIGRTLQLPPERMLFSRHGDRLRRHRACRQRTGDRARAAREVVRYIGFEVPFGGTRGTGFAGPLGAPP
jgi:hypothetical protein